MQSSLNASCICIYMLFIRSTAWRFRRRKVLRMAPSPQRRRARRRAQQHHCSITLAVTHTIPSARWQDSLDEGNRLRRQRSFRRSWTCTGSWHSKCRETWTTHVIAFAFAFDFCRASSMSSFLPVRRLSPVVAFPDVHAVSQDSQLASRPKRGALEGSDHARSHVAAPGCLSDM